MWIDDEFDQPPEIIQADKEWKWVSLLSDERSSSEILSDEESERIMKEYFDEHPTPDCYRHGMLFEDYYDECAKATKNRDWVRLAELYETDLTPELIEQFEQVADRLYGTFSEC